MSMIIDGDSVVYDLTALDDTDSTFTTSGEEFHTVDTSSGTLTVQLSTAGTTAGAHKRFVDVGGAIETNAVTFTTEGSENVDGGSSVTWDQNNGSYIDLWSDGTNWFTSLQAAFDALAADAATIASLTDGASNTITDFAGSNLSVSGNTLNAADSDLKRVAVSTATNTSGSGVYLVDTSSAGVTLTLDSDDATGNATIVVVNVDGTNDVTVDTEGAETIDPGGASSKTISNAGEARRYTSDGTNWDESSVVEFEEINNSDYHETVSTDATVTGATNIDVSAANAFEHTLTGNTTYSFTNPSSDPAGNSFALLVEQDGTGGHTLSWPGTVEWPGGTEPSVNTTASAKHEFIFRSYDGGTSWIGSVTEDIS